MFETKDIEGERNRKKKKTFNEIHEDLRIKDNNMPLKDRIEQHVTITSGINITR